MILQWLKRLLRSRVAGGAIEGSLTGLFDYREAEIAGWVDEIPYATTGGLTIEVMRHGIAIASCRTEQVADRGRLAFTLPIRGMFTARELANEAIQIVARSDRGDSGMLKLDGATQIDLVRKYLGVPCETVFDLDCVSNGNAGPYLGEGWTAAGEEYTWTEGDDSLVHFQSPDATGTYLLRIRAGAFISAMVPVQKVEIFINDAMIAAFIADHGTSGFWEFRIEGNVFSDMEKSVLRIHHPYAARPIDHSDDNRDSRRLALSVRSVSLVLVLEC